MKEFMLLIRNKAKAQETWSSEEHLQFVKKCEIYIKGLKKIGRLIAAQPLAREGVMISGTIGKWKESTYNETSEIQVGYYHISARNMKDAIAIAKKNPEFAFSATARIEVRLIKTKEKKTGFKYPKR